MASSSSFTSDIDYSWSPYSSSSSATDSKYNRGAASTAVVAGVDPDDGEQIFVAIKVIQPDVNGNPGMPAHVAGTVRRWKTAKANYDAGTVAKWNQSESPAESGPTNASAPSAFFSRVHVNL